MDNWPGPELPEIVWECRLQELALSGELREIERKDDRELVDLWDTTSQRLWGACPLPLEMYESKEMYTQAIAYTILALKHACIGLAGVADRHGFDGTPYWQVAGKLPSAMPDGKEWDSAWALTRRIEVRLNSQPKGNGGASGSEAAEDATIEETPSQKGWQFQPGNFTLNGQTHKLSGIRWRLLKVLAEARLPLEMKGLIDSVWQDENTENGTVQKAISSLRGYLRKELGLPRALDPIECVDRGVLVAWRLNEKISDVAKDGKVPEKSARNQPPVSGR